MIGFFIFMPNSQIISMAVNPEDIALLQEFRAPATKEKAFTAIIKKYQEKLYWHIRRMVVEHEDANDVLQNMFIKVWNGLENFREDSQLYTWLYRIATNESLTFLEQQKKRSSISIDNEESNLWLISILTPTNLNGNCNWRCSNYLRNKELYLILDIMMKCPMKK